jgi:hypothetical protein
MTRETFTIAAIALVCGTEQQPRRQSRLNHLAKMFRAGTNRSPNESNPTTLLSPTCEFLTQRPALYSGSESYSLRGAPYE